MPEEILTWFATELTAALDVDFLAGWIVLASGGLALYGDAGRLADAYMRAELAGAFMHPAGLATCHLLRVRRTTGDVPAGRRLAGDSPGT